MVMPRDWLPPYRPGDVRNEVHREAYNKAAAAHPEWRWRQCNDYADDVLAGWLLNPPWCECAPGECKALPHTRCVVSGFAVPLEATPDQRST